MRPTIRDIMAKKKQAEKICMLTAYDYPMAKFIDQANVDMVLVGDSLANVVLGLESTTQVGMDEMIHHTKAVNRAVKNAALIGDMPYGSYDHVDEAIKNAERFTKEAGCDAIKLEWFDGCPEVAAALSMSGVPVMGHVGLTPQTAEEFKVQGKDALSADQIIQHAKELEQNGCFSVVLECVPSALAKVITESIAIPTIGIGAGVECDGQVLVVNDILGLFDAYRPKFVKQYVNAGEMVVKGVKQFVDEVKSGQFPDQQHSFGMDKDEFDKLNL